MSGEGRLPLPLVGAGKDLPHQLQAVPPWLRLLTVVGAAAGRGARPQMGGMGAWPEGGD